MIFEFFPVLGFWSGLGWGLAGCVIAFLALLMILSIVFLQDSKEGGLGGAFGSAGGGDSVEDIRLIEELWKRLPSL